MAEEPETPQSPDTPQDLSQLVITEFANNPLYSNIGLLDHGVPAPNFNYRWNVYLDRWEPMARDSEDLLTHRLLSGVREDLAAIEIDVEIDSDAETHRLLSGVIDIIQEEQDETQRDLNSFAEATEDQLNSLLSAAIQYGEDNNDLLHSGLKKDDSTHDLLSGLISYAIEYGEDNNELLSSGLRKDDATHDLLSGLIQSTDTAGEINEQLLDKLADLMSIFSQKHEAIGNTANEILSGVREDLEEIHIDVTIDSDIETHKLLSGIIEHGIENESLIQEQNLLTSGSNFLINEQNLLTAESNDLLDEQIDLISGSNEILKSIFDTLPTGLSTITELQKTGINILESIEKKLHLKSKTKTITHKIEEDFILLEDIPEDLRFGESQKVCFGTNTQLEDELFLQYFPNARRDISQPETGHPDFFLHAEYVDPDRCVQSYNTFHSDSELSLRFENKDASKINAYKLNLFEELYEDGGNLESVTIYNESNYPLLFFSSHSGEDISKNDDMFSIQAENAVKLMADKKQNIFIKRPYTISGFNLKYAITYKSK